MVATRGEEGEKGPDGGGLGYHPCRSGERWWGEYIQISEIVRLNRDALWRA